MKENEVTKLYDGITDISEEYINEAQIKRGKKQSAVWVKWGALAACVCLIFMGLLVWRKVNKPSAVYPNVTVSDNEITNPPIDASQASAAQDDINGVTIPPLNVSLSSDGQADMIGFFIYQGRCYVSYEYNLRDNNIVGEHLGYATGMINEWMPEDGYVDFAGSAWGDFYSVKGFDPEFMLCIKHPDGSIETFINNNGITLKKGSELFEERLHLSDEYIDVQYETRSSWYYSEYELYQLNDPNNAIISEFISQLDEAEFMLSNVIIQGEQGHPSDKEIYHMYFVFESGINIHLRIYEGGYVCFDGLLDVCVKLSDEKFERLTDLFANQTEWTAFETPDDSITFEDCISDIYLGAYVPQYVPDDLMFNRAYISYYLDAETAKETKTKDITIEYNHYSATITWSDEYGENGWAGPMLNPEEVSVAAVEDAISQYKHREGDISIGVWYGDVSIVVSSSGLNTETVCRILASIDIND